MKTTLLAFGEIQGAPQSAGELIRSAYKAVINGSQSGSDATVRAWAEYELRRLVHFGLELLLSALTDTLIDLTAGSVERVVAEWNTNQPLPPFLYTILPHNGPVMATSLLEVEAILNDDPITCRPTDTGTPRDLAPDNRALYALALLISCAKRTTGLRNDQRPSPRGDQDYLERTFGILKSDSSRTVGETLTVLLKQAVIEPHLSATLRKMGQGQKCSLRFYTEGDLLRPTGTLVRAGYSGDRLGNLLRMWADLGHLEWQSDGRYRLTKLGQGLLASELRI
jgi:hypothetical protein